MLGGEREIFPPLISASPRYLFDFTLALMSLRDREKTHAKCSRTNFNSLTFLRVLVEKDEWSAQLNTFVG